MYKLLYYLHFIHWSLAYANFNIYMIYFPLLRPEICEKYFLSFPQKIYKLRQLSLSQFVYNNIIVLPETL